jgi:hypothetical protein
MLPVRRPVQFKILLFSVSDPTVPADKPHKCEICQQRFSAKQALEQHILIHSDERPLVCDYEGCGARFRQQSALSKSLGSLSHQHRADDIFSHAQTNAYRREAASVRDLWEALPGIVKPVKAQTNA